MRELRPKDCRGLCNAHYLRLNRYGDVNFVTPHGKKHTEQWKINISNGHKGKKHSEETRNKISAGVRGKMSGEKNPAWKGGISPLRSKIRRSFEYKIWRTSIFQRDNYTCVNCNTRGGQLHVDHFPLSFAEIIKRNNICSMDDAVECDELWDIKNNRTLCVSCHKKTFNYFNGKDKCY